ncbi:MAG: ribosomal-protein-alanine N-acetyltransferase [Deltaproteobacteria bacterium]|nr:ribosomal-protein-alanine N-acetyltransferase [Deltaproteobacteria bacterium]
MDQIFKRQIRSLHIAGQPVEIVLRQLAKADIQDIRTIAKDSFPKVWSESEFDFFINHEHGLCLGAFRESQLLGYLLCLLIQGELDVITVAVEPQLRRLHIAETLLRAALEFEMVEQAFLEVESQNQAAIRFYEKVGFKKYGIRKKYYEGQRDALVMKIEKGRPGF